MNFREWLKDNPALVAIAAIIVVVIALVFMVRQFQRRVTPVDRPTALQAQWFFDMGDGKLFVADPQWQDGPIPAPSGAKQADGAPGGLRAAVFACGSCQDPAAHFIGYIEAYSAKALAGWKKVYGNKPFRPMAIGGVVADQHPEIVNGLQISAPPPDSVLRAAWKPSWVDAGSEDGKKLRRAPSEQCKAQGKRIEKCLPAPGSKPAVTTKSEATSKPEATNKPAATSKPAAAR